ncbi:hypothetical protein [Nonlabens marinus]|uniref:Uncharacterized protein n=1 Tax=Nonlabens marinus S1-08 TaxID=1454201 RepID=W8VWL8_9FLAO|nr:hypothetical protein [Nonlabens marinus]BAO54852.1 hypothetical protein NMS_0843 [Nonlabens marinus S1-08]
MLRDVAFALCVWVAIASLIFLLIYYVVVSIAKDFFQKDLNRSPLLEIVHILLQVGIAIGVSYYFLMMA